MALLHKRSRTLLVTDSVLAVPEKPPEIVKKSSIGEDLKESGSQPLPEEDLEFIRKLEENLTKRGITSPAKEKV